VESYKNGKNQMVRASKGWTCDTLILKIHFRISELELFQILSYNYFYFGYLYDLSKIILRFNNKKS